MLFNSFSYAVFLPIVFIFYWLIPHKFRWIFLLATSYYFYMNWNPKYVLLILGTTVVSYVSGLILEKCKSVKIKRATVLGAAVICFGILFFFKYFNFASESVCGLLGLFKLNFSPVTLKLMLPIGISFYTFQTFGYVFDVYKGKTPAEHHFGYYAAFVSFFPQLAAGPIARADKLLPQLKAERKFNYGNAVNGLQIMLFGYFKKMVIADTLAYYVDVVYNDLHSYSGFSVVLAILFFTIQIYCDFSGYSDIAIGSAKLLGINLMQNFNCPYFSVSIKEFWGRWHISLSTWFRDYVYIPLGGNRCSKFRHSLNLLITFLVSGLWHGANWTYIVWGAMHGVMQIIENIFKKPLKRLRNKRIGRVLSWAFVFAFCSFAWIFFRADSIKDAFYVIATAMSGITSPALYISSGISNIGLSVIGIGEMFIMLLVLTLLDLQAYRGEPFLPQKWPSVCRWICYFVLVWLIIILVPNAAGDFIYFQF